MTSQQIVVAVAWLVFISSAIYGWFGLGLGNDTGFWVISGLGLCTGLKAHRTTAKSARIMRLLNRNSLRRI